MSNIHISIGNAMITKLAVELVFGFAPLAAPAINRHYRLLGLHTV